MASNKFYFEHPEQGYILLKLINIIYKFKLYYTFQMPTWWRCWSKTAEDKNTSITVLDLSHQSLIDVPNDVFNHERTLEELYLNSNRVNILLY